MAEELSPRKKDGAKRTGKRSTRVDLTPMVDLGFLLLTFFVFTTTLSSAKVMDLDTPNDKDTTKHDLVCESCALTIILSGNDKIWYYEGMEGKAQYHQTDFSSRGLRALLTRKKKEVDAIKRTVGLIIKSTPHCKFKNLIDAIDESTIAGYPPYFLDELSAADKTFLAATEP